MGWQYFKSCVTVLFVRCRKAPLKSTTCPAQFLAHSPHLGIFLWIQSRQPFTSFSAEKPRNHRSIFTDLHTPSPFLSSTCQLQYFIHHSVFSVLSNQDNHWPFVSTQSWGLQKQAALPPCLTTISYSGLFLLLHTWIRSQHVLASKREIFLRSSL